MMTVPIRVKEGNSYRHTTAKQIFTQAGLGKIT